MKTNTDSLTTIDTIALGAVVGGTHRTKQMSSTDRAKAHANARGDLRACIYDAQQMGFLFGTEGVVGANKACVEAYAERALDSAPKAPKDFLPRLRANNPE